MNANTDGVELKINSSEYFIKIDFIFKSFTGII